MLEFTYHCLVIDYFHKLNFDISEDIESFIEKMKKVYPGIWMDFENTIIKEFMKYQCIHPISKNGYCKSYYCPEVKK